MVIHVWIIVDITKKTKKKLRPFQSVLLANPNPILYSLLLRRERTKTMAMVGSIVTLCLLLMLLVIIIVIFFACKPWRFFSSSPSRPIKVLSFFFFPGPIFSIIFCLPFLRKNKIGC